jgi:hypothetical protein
MPVFPKEINPINLLLTWYVWRLTCISVMKIKLKLNIIVAFMMGSKYKHLVTKEVCKIPIA